MNYFRTSPIGIDTVIHKIQNKLISLDNVFGVEFDSYPRCYVNQKEEGNDFEYFIKGNDYRSVLHAERNKSFFIHDSNITNIDTFNFETEIKLYFIVNLKDIDSIERNDSKLIKEVAKLIRQVPDVELINIDRDFQNIFKNTSFGNSFDFLHPYFSACFTIKVIRYELDKTPCNG